MNTNPNTQPAAKRAKPRRSAKQRGVIGVVSMMFLVLFASLATTMAIVTQGNMRSSVAHVRVNRAIAAVDTGLQIAMARLDENAARFVVARGDVTPEYAAQLWNGTFPANPPVTILAPAMGRDEDTLPSSLRAALINHHNGDDEDNLVNWPSSDNVPAPIPQTAAPNGWVVTKPIGLQRNPSGLITTAVQITYLPPDDLGRVLVLSTGYTWDFTRTRWVTRTAQQHFQITKFVEHAVLAPSRVMIGRNVQINGPLGIRYDSDALNSVDGPPLQMVSDFLGLDPILDEKLDDFFQAVLDDDTDGDNRLAIAHDIEGRSLGALNAVDYDGDGIPDNAIGDATRDGRIDEFDIFIKHYDTNNDNRLTLSSTLTDGTPAAGNSAEFTADDALAEVIDMGVPDRNANGRVNGRFFDGDWIYETFPAYSGPSSIGASDVDHNDVALGYRDGYLDAKDQYAKIHGTVTFRASRSQWESMTDRFGTPTLDYQKNVEGPINPERGDPAVEFDASNEVLPIITPDSFDSATQGLIEIANDYALEGTFAQQVEAQMGAGWTPPTAIEGTPYGTPSPADWYRRPVYEDMTFSNVTIPMGTNALFRNCTFLGVTFVQSYADNSHPSWSFYGEQTRDPVNGDLAWVYPQTPASDVALDKSWAEPSYEGYDDLPDPLFVTVDLDGDGTAFDQCINTKEITNNIRFHGCTFYGSIVSTRTTFFQNKRNKIQFTGPSRFLRAEDYTGDADFTPTDEELEEMSRSSLMLPNYSVDIGTNNADAEQDVRLRGAIVSGVIDIRGNATVDGILLADFQPVFGVPPLVLYDSAVGNPADFNITLGYFSPAQGDEEGIDLGALSDLNGDGLDDLGWDSARNPETGALITEATAAGLGYASADNYPDEWFDGVADDAWNSAGGGPYARRIITFNGYGKIVLNWDPEIVLPDGLATPLRIRSLRSTYEEGRYIVLVDEEEG